MSETTPRFIPAEASFTDPISGASEIAWGVHDTREDRFAPFGGNEALANLAAERMAEMPYLPWSFVSDFTLTLNS